MSLDHFLNVARRGARGACSGGERAAHNLATVVVDCAPRLDGQAVEGLIEFIRGASLDPQAAREILAWKEASGAGRRSAAHV